jgi:PAS domain S-box-containing protein
MSETQGVILNVDDDAPDRNATGHILKQAGFEVIEADTGTDALRLAQQQPDLILLDMNLPDIDGLEVCRRLKTDVQTATIPILQMSDSAGGAETYAPAVDGVADAYLAEPVAPRELIATIHALLRTRKAEEAVRISESRFRSLIEATAQMVWTASPDGQHIKEVSGWGACTPKDSEEGTGPGWLDAVHPQDRARVAHEWEDAVRAASNVVMRCQLRTATGEYCHFALRAVPIRETDGSIREWIGVFVDIQEQQKLESVHRFLAEASTLLSSSLDYKETLSRVAALALPALADFVAIETRAPNGALEARSIAHHNPARERLARELLDKYPRPLSSTSGMPQVLRTGKSEVVSDITDEMLVTGAQDDEHLRLLRALALKSFVIVPLTARGKTLGVMTFATEGPSGRSYGPDDVELFQEIARRAAIAVDNSRLYGEAVEASRAKSEFLAVMSHELRTPMNAVIGYADLLDAGVGGTLTEAQRKHVQRINASAHHLITIIDQILTFSRVEAGVDFNLLEDVDLASVVHETGQLILPVAQKKAIDLRIDVQQGITMHTDAGKLRQIVLNLLSNAIKFTDLGSVDVLVREVGEGVEITVQDTGIGILPSDLGRIFDPFWQVEQSMTRRVGGSGLGLGVTRALAKLLGGDVAVTSEPGKGSTFTVTLPLIAPQNIPV